MMKETKGTTISTSTYAEVTRKIMNLLFFTSPKFESVTSVTEFTLSQ